MAGTTEGGKKAVETNYKRYGKDYYSIIGKYGGGVKGLKKGFAIHNWNESAEKKQMDIAKRGKNPRKNVAKKK